MKNLIIFHYHFLPGGVTDVVTSAAISYLNHSKMIGKITIVSGRQKNLENITSKIRKSLRRNSKKSICHEVLPSIDYLENLSDGITTETIKYEILERYASEDNIWWIHNYHLGKNPYLTKALIEIADDRKQNMVFHIHDFPECSRYALLKRLKDVIKGDLYPRTANVHYAVINSRDFHFLTEAGIEKELITLLENPIKPVIIQSDRKKDTYAKLSGSIADSFPGWRKKEPYMLYPVRAIRRKNIAEAALISSLTDKNIIITLPGVSEAEKAYSNSCKEIFTSGLAPGMFGIGFEMENYDISFDELIGSSSVIVSSSVQEGFGYLFLNSMNWGKPLFARDLDILTSFKKSFKNFPSHFYHYFSVPLESNESEILQSEYFFKLKALQSELDEEKLEELQQLFAGILDSPEIDFSYLTLDLQISVLKRISVDCAYREKCRNLNRANINIINDYFELDISPNHKILEKNWSFASYCIKTDKILQKFDKSPICLNREKRKKPIFETMQFYFTTPDYFRLLYDE